MTQPLRTTDGPIHLHFGLTYAEYLVLPRTLLQSMPLDWQDRFVACVEELSDAFRHVPQAETYDVHAATAHIVSEMSSTELRAAGVIADWYGGETAPAGLSEVDLIAWRAEHERDEATYYDDAGTELDPHSRVLIRTTDPVPHYNRGRTYIEPAP